VSGVGGAVASMADEKLRIAWPAAAAVILAPRPRPTAAPPSKSGTCMQVVGIRRPFSSGQRAQSDAIRGHQRFGDGISSLADAIRGHQRFGDGISSLADAIRGHQRFGDGTSSLVALACVSYTKPSSWRAKRSGSACPVATTCRALSRRCRPRG
jgi:hypothetical protein